MYYNIGSSNMCFISFKTNLKTHTYKQMFDFKVYMYNDTYALHTCMQTRTQTQAPVHIHKHTRTRMLTSIPAVACFTPNVHADDSFA